ncbi:hypothetical protein [Paenibacillus xylanilyticus]|uniref:Uncharacterized protein n=1 Tax=Paenibacillus xylanilyticus TaxID=248903 RepID=A0A7Y6BST3_9BACL|nr:hypothetical protein [Paenibacillus xylanilyticus]NUU74249.1 hypothetical protein [Paenibacillus xylanilyticus]
MTDINTHIQHATTMIHGDVTVSVAKEIFESVKEELKEIQRMEDSGLLGYRGRFEKEDEVRKKGALQLAQALKTNQEMVNEALDIAEKQAHEVLGQAAAPPPEYQLREFNERYTELKANLQVNANQQSARQLLEFMRGVNDPYLAHILTQDYAELGGALIKHSGDPISVNTLYGTLRSARDSAEQTQARVALQEIAQLRQTRSYNQMLELGADKTLGPIGRSAMNDPAGFVQASEGGAS